jgi:GNAT superfamily N-acetyltransferase
MSLPSQKKAAQITVRQDEDVALLAELTRLDKTVITERISNGHHSYTAWMSHTPVAYGWVATESAIIGELDLFFRVASNHLYLWDFKTLSGWRGRGIYPHLLQNILQTAVNDQQCWIAHSPENSASRHGIEAAGFSLVGKLSFQKSTTAPVLSSPEKETQYAQLAAKMLNVELMFGEKGNQMIAPCWRCVTSAKLSVAFVPPACWTDECGCAVDQSS